jgi:hypothetical protein
MEIATVTTVLAPLAVLACPVGMGLMMWLMARGNRGERGSDRQAPSEQPPSLEVLREERRRLNGEIELLERRHASGAEAPPERR